MRKGNNANVLTIRARLDIYEAVINAAEKLVNNTNFCQNKNMALVAMLVRGKEALEKEYGS